MTQQYTEHDQDAVEKLLMGRQVTDVTDNRLTLDDGTVLTFVGNEGGCSCGAGDYDLTSLARVDNVITRVEFVNDPDGDDYSGATGVYEIFVYAENEKISLARFEGSDGNGYYGTGYTILVEAPDA